MSYGLGCTITLIKTPRERERKVVCRDPGQDGLRFSGSAELTSSHLTVMGSKRRLTAHQLLASFGPLYFRPNLSSSTRGQPEQAIARQEAHQSSPARNMSCHPLGRPLESLLLLGAVDFQFVFSEIQAHTFSVTLCLCTVRCILVLKPFLI